jgi:hypothetical protein
MYESVEDEKESTAMACKSIHIEKKEKQRARRVVGREY